MLNIIRKLQKTVISSGRQFSTITSQLTSTTEEKRSPFNNTCIRPFREIWVENVDTPEQKNLEIIELHPEIYATMPRVDIIHENIDWQRKYRFVSYAHTKTRNEVRGGGRKPWPQKGGGRARHGSIRSPLFKGGGVIHGPRSPTTHFYMLPYFTRVLGLTSTLSVKLAQDDLHVIKDLNIPTDEPKFLQDLIKERCWGPSCLFVDDLDIIPENIALAMEDLGHVNFVPVYGLNVYMMLKHETLILTKSAALTIQEKLLQQLNKNDGRAVMKRFRPNQ
uniref:Large ribosomal subunit protein uL4m n=1 Tax=Culicoides sonorensis TaxID=179676 RepID=A0A336M9T7_CULSO